MEITLKNGLTTLQSAAAQLLRPIPTIFILFTSFAIIVAVMSSYDTYTYLFGEISPKQLSFQLFMVPFSVLCYAPSVILINKFIFKKSAENIGLQMPRNKRSAVYLILLTLAYTIPAFTYLLSQPSLTQFYSYGPCSIYLFIGMQLLFPAFYLAEELFFRGFLFLSLWDRIGWHSFWVSDMLFTIAHAGKPPLEIALCIPMSILLNFMTLRTRSVYPAFFVHTVLGIFTFTLININSVYW